MILKEESQDVTPRIEYSTEAFESALNEPADSEYVLHLYVSGMTPNSLHAIENIMKICAEYLEGHYDLEIIDILQQKNIAKESQIVAAPTLIKTKPLPSRKFIGNMSRTDKILKGLNLHRKR